MYPIEMSCDKQANNAALFLQIYRACEIRGRIAYKRSGGSRLITQNDHWKSQIRHALYTSERFVRCAMAVAASHFNGFQSCAAVCSMANESCIGLVSTSTDMLQITDTSRDLLLSVQSFRGRRLLDGVQKLHKGGAWNNHRASAHQWGGHSCHR